MKAHHVHEWGQALPMQGREMQACKCGAVRPVRERNSKKATK